MSHETFLGLVTLCGSVARSWNRLAERRLLNNLTFSVSLQVGYGVAA